MANTMLSWIIVSALMVGIDIKGGQLAMAQGSSHAFYVDELPSGGSVTLPQPVVTYLSMESRVRFKATDKPQTLKLQSVRTDRKAAKTIKVAVFDRNLKTAKYIKVSPDNPYLYNFRGLSTVVLMAEPDASEANHEHMKLAIESDKPIEITR